MHKIRDMLGADSAAGRSHAHAFIYWDYDQHRKWQSMLQLLERPLHHLVGSNTCTVIQCDTWKQSYQKSTGQEIEALWQEYEDCKSPEALMVKDFDKVPS